MAAFARYIDPWGGRALLMEEHAPGRFHRAGWIEYGSLDKSGLFSNRHNKSQLVVGGPQPRNMQNTKGAEVAG